VDSTATIDLFAFGVVLLAYAGIGLLWLTLALRTNRRD